MSDREARLLDKVARKVLSDESARAGDPWAPLLDGEWIGVGVSEDRGGSGGGLPVAAALATAAGAVGSASPVTEAILAGIMLGADPAGESELASAASGSPRTILASGLALEPTIEPGASVELAVSGLVLPYWEPGARVVLPLTLTDGAAGMAVVDVDALAPLLGSNVALESRARLPAGSVLSAEVRRLDLSRSELEDIVGALCAARLVGAMRSAVDLAVQYANERKQFGRSIGRFQAVAHPLVRATGEVEQVAAVLDIAVHSPAGTGAGVAARVLAGRGARIVAEITHQVHAAIGTTRDYPLHRYTLRLTAWRNELGSTGDWARRLAERQLDTDWESLDDTLAEHHADAVTAAG